jgi:hypothetical protein
LTKLKQLSTKIVPPPVEEDPPLVLEDMEGGSPEAKPKGRRAKRRQKRRAKKNSESQSESEKEESDKYTWYSAANRDQRIRYFDEITQTY